MLIEGNSNNKDDIFNEFVISDLTRLAYSYLIFIIFALMLVKFVVSEGSNLTPVIIISIVYIIITLTIELLWLFLFTNKERVNDDSSKTIVHTLLNNVLPITALMFGYIILIDGFRPGGNSNSIEYILKSITAMIFFVSYLYLFISLVNMLTGKKKPGSAVKSAMNSKFTDVTDNSKSKLTYYDHLIDILYNLFQPISVIFVSIMLYYIIRLMYGSGGSSSQNVSSPPPMASQPLPTPPPQ
tara:strand:- start:1411 stop:2133 length:723 start_codon:yes stop_codon:yes gene_type:complete